MRCPSAEDGHCPSEDPLETHHTDQYSTYYCQTCGFEDKVVWPTPTQSPKRRERREESPPRPRPPRRKRSEK